MALFGARSISTGKIEGSFSGKAQYTIVIVTHNMRQAARVAEYRDSFSSGAHDRVRQDGESLRIPRTSAPKHITARFG
jgi:ABC-type phosphate transport system ATPase subunit